MLHQIKTAASRARDTIVLDAIGAAALMVTLVGALYLPGRSDRIDPDVSAGRVRFPDVAYPEIGMTPR